MKKPSKSPCAALRRTVILRAAVLVAAAALLLPACSARESLFFDDPEIKLVLDGPLGKAPRGGGTLLFGDVRNDGSLTAENVVAHITLFGAGGATLGSVSTAVGTGYEEEEGITDTIEPGQMGSFSTVADIPFALIASETVSFDYTKPIEEEE